MRRLAAALFTARSLIVCSVALALLLAGGGAIALRPRISSTDGTRETFAGEIDGEKSLVEVDTSTGETPPV